MMVIMIKLEKLLLILLLVFLGYFVMVPNSSCSIKIANGTYAAYDGAASAMNGNVVTSGDGIVADDVEATIRNIGE